MRAGRPAGWSASPSTTATPAAGHGAAGSWTGRASAPPRSSSPTGSVAPTSGNAGPVWPLLDRRPGWPSWPRPGSRSARTAPPTRTWRACPPAAGGRGQREPRRAGGPASARAGVRLPVRVDGRGGPLAVGAAGYEYACAVEAPMAEPGAAGAAPDLRRQQRRQPGPDDRQTAPAQGLRRDQGETRDESLHVITGLDAGGAELQLDAVCGAPGTSQTSSRCTTRARSRT